MGSFCKSGDKPMIFQIDNVYKGKGWVDWGDWLGAGYIHPSKDYINHLRRRDCSCINKIKSEKTGLFMLNQENLASDIPKILIKLTEKNG